MHESQEHGRNTSGSWRGSSAEWIAVGALVAGSVGAFIGARHCARRNNRTAHSERPDAASVTAPHGDKLEAVLR